MDLTTDVLDRITTALELLAVRDNRPRVKVTAPTYDGTGDVELFIRHFTDVANASEWTDDIALLQLRNSLKDRAAECSRAVDYPAVVEALRMRFGTSPSEAQALLANVRRDNRTSLSEYAAHVSRLVHLANTELPADYRRTMILRTFKSILGHVGLQRHLLVANVQNLEDAVRIGAEYLQIGSQAATRYESKVATCDVTDEDEDVRVKPVNVDTDRDILVALQSLTARLEKMEASLKQEKKPLVCFECNQPGHVRARCPHKKSGNEAGPRN